MLRSSLWSVYLIAFSSWVVSCKNEKDSKPENETIAVAQPPNELNQPLEKQPTFSHEALIAMFPEITDLNWSFTDQDIYHTIDKKLDQYEFCDMLSQAISYDVTFNEWKANYTNDLGDEYGWAQIYPIGKIIGKNGINLFFQTYTQTSATNGGFWDIWMVQFEEYHSVDYGYEGLKSQLIGSDGFYQYVESNNSEEGDEFEYFISNYEYEKIQIKRVSEDSIQTTIKRYSLAEGYDWRIDQDLSINDSIAMSDIITYQILN